MTNHNTADAKDNKKYTYQEYYEMGLKIVKEDAKHKADDSEIKEN